jgi:hypothetical protein
MQVKSQTGEYVPNTAYLASLLAMKSLTASTGKKAIRVHVDNMILFRSRTGEFTRSGNEAQDYQPCQITTELLKLTETAAKLRFGSDDVKKVVVCDHTWEEA